MPENGPITVVLAGPMALMRGGERLSLPGRKARALLAMLILSPRGCHARRWLQDRLWSDRGEVQGAASLRQALVEIRRSLGPDADIVRAEGDLLWLDRTRLVVDVLTPGASIAQGAELLEGLDIRDPEFESWLTQARAEFEAGRLVPTPLPLASRRAAAQLQTSPVDQGPRPYGLAEQPGPEFETVANGARQKTWGQPCLALLPAAVPPGRADLAHLAGSAMDGVARCLLDWELIDLFDLRDFDAAGGGIGTTATNGPDLALRCRVEAQGDEISLGVGLWTGAGNRLVWAQSVCVSPTVATDDPPLAEFVLRCADAVLQAMHRVVAQAQDGPRLAAKLAIGAIHQFFIYRNPDFALAEQQLELAYALAPQPSLLAWKAFGITFQFGETPTPINAGRMQQCRALFHMALEEAPHNALVHALAAQAHGFVFRDMGRARDLAARAVLLNPLQPLAWDTDAMTRCYAGDPQGGMVSALRGAELARLSPYHYYFETSCCIAATLSGDFATAIGHGEAVLARQPDFAAAMRYMAVSQGHAGAHEPAARLLGRLRAREPDLSVERLRAADHPLHNAKGLELIEQGLVLAGLPRHPTPQIAGETE